MAEARIDTKPDWLQEVSGGLDAVPGVECAGIHAGIKAEGLDMALFRTERTSTVAGTFTLNAFRAAPVQVSAKRAAGGRAQAVIVNSGNANCCTGEKGMQDALAMAKRVAERLNLPEDEIFVCSTGKIGIPMPTEKVLAGIDQLAGKLGRHGDDAAQAILTTDTRKKTIAVQFEHEGRKITIAGIAKGAGMICPNMATMLSFIFTDASIDAGSLQTALKQAVEVSFNSITVEGDTSTNDTVLVFANGLAGPAKDGPGFRTLFAEALQYVCVSPAKMIPADAEGATKFLEVRVEHAHAPVLAKRAAMFVANSVLWKTALFGQQANWGRIAAALGASGVWGMEPSKTKIVLNGFTVMEDGALVKVDEAALEASMKQHDISIDIDLCGGPGAWTVWTSDLSYEYIRCNVDMS